MIRVSLILSALSVFTLGAFAQAPPVKPNAQQANISAPSASPLPTPGVASTPMPASVVAGAAAPATSPESPNPKPTSASASAPAAKGTVVLPAEKASPVTVPRFATPPVIDGKLDEVIWQSAAVLKDFYQIDPGDNIAPSKPTEVLLGYDAKFLYLAFRAFDEPDKVRSTVAKRDSIFQDDYVGFFLDTFNDKRKAFEVFFNPLGIQGDGVLTEGRGEDFSVDLLLDSKGTINETGYTVEVAIPFKSLRYEAGKGKLWGAHFFRRIQRFNRELSSWMPFSRSIDSNLSQSGHLSGLEGITAEKTIEFIPSLTLSESGRFVRTFGAPFTGPDPGRILNEPMRFDPGLTAKFTPSSALTLDLAINPDFAQVEADQLVVEANQRFPIFFAEKRPFFLEGIDIFRTPITAVHTRAIVDPDIALKLSGKKGPTTFGMMVASDNGPGNLSLDDRELLRRRDLDVDSDDFSKQQQFFRLVDKNAHIGVLRLKRDIGKENSIGMLATTYNFIQKHNDLLGIDGRFRLNKQTTWTFQALGTTSRNHFFNANEGESRYRTGNGLGYTTSYNVSGRNWGYELFAEGYTQDYRADVGFFQRTNSNFNSFFLRYNSDPQPKKKLISYHLHQFTHVDYDWQGRFYEYETELLAELSLPRSSYVGVWFEPGYERLFDHEFGATREARPCNPFAVEDKCTFYGEDNERSTRKATISGYFGSNYSKKVQFNSQFTYRMGTFDLDFGNGRKYPRVSPAALLLGEDAPLDPGSGNMLQINSGITYQPTNELRTQFNLVKQRLVRNDNGRTAFDINILTFRGTYQFTKATFARTIVDYNTLSQKARAQFLAGWTPSPGTSFYVGYNDDLNLNESHPFTREIVPGFRRNSRTFFIKMSYLIRKSFGSD
jgi:Domain of unknown function (DUF5916)/Carbohydrate family 9 binding domain-like